MRILIVDDDQSVHMYLEQILSAFGQCDSALLGEEGVTLFKEAHLNGQPYDVVLMDILMPGMNGHETAGKMRAIEDDLKISKYHQFKLVMITSLVDESNVSKAFFDSNALCYIVKPLIKENVLDELRQNLVI